MSVICRAVDVDAPNVTTDEALAMERAMDYLLENGHRNIGIIEGNPGLDSSRLRRRGWRTSMTSHGLDRMPFLLSAALPVCQRIHRGKQLLTFGPRPCCV